MRGLRLLLVAAVALAALGPLAAPALAQYVPNDEVLGGEIVRGGNDRAADEVRGRFQRGGDVGAGGLQGEAGKVGAGDVQGRELSERGPGAGLTVTGRELVFYAVAGLLLVMAGTALARRARRAEPVR